MRTALRNPRLRRLLAAYLAFVAAEWGTWLAVLIYAFEADGPAAVGIVAVVQLIPAAAVAPFAPALIARLRRPSPLVFAYAVQAGAVALTALAVLTAPSWAAYAAAALLTTSLTLARPAHAAALVAVARSPAELTAANAAGGTVDGAGIITGPVAVGILYGTIGPAGFLLVIAGGLCVAAVLAISARVERWQAGPIAMPTGRALREALRVTTDRGGPAVATLALVAVWAAAGLLDVLVVVLVMGELGGGSELVGALNAAMGVGGVAAGLIAARLVGGQSVLSVGIGLAIAAGALAVAAVLRGPVVALVMFALIGVGYGLAEVGSRSTLLRLAPARSVGPVFGLVEGIYAGALALGAAVGPPLLLAAPVPVGMAAIAVGLAVTAVALFPALVRAARAIHVPAAELDVLRRTPLFAPLPVPTVEWLARSAARVDVAPGQAIIREGEPGDRFYVIDRGRVEVSTGGRTITSLGEGDSFGEIALLRDTPRTATVTAVMETSLVAMDRDVFVGAVTDHALATTTAEATVEARLRRDPGGRGTVPG